MLTVDWLTQIPLRLRLHGLHRIPIFNNKFVTQILPINHSRTRLTPIMMLLFGFGLARVGIRVASWDRANVFPPIAPVGGQLGNELSTLALR